MDWHGSVEWMVPSVSGFLSERPPESPEEPKRLAKIATIITRDRRLGICGRMTHQLSPRMGTFCNSPTRGWSSAGLQGFEPWTRRLRAACATGLRYRPRGATHASLLEVTERCVVRVPSRHSCTIAPSAARNLPLASEIACSGPPSGSGSDRVLPLRGGDGTGPVSRNPT